MKAFIDASCSKCGRRFGWFGTLADRPRCPGCGDSPDQAVLDDAEAKMQAARDRMDTHPKDASADMRRQQRIDAGLTLRQAARLLEVDGAFLSEIENGRREPTADFADRMARVYDVGPQTEDTTT